MNNMTDKTNSAKDICLCYRSPEVNVIEVNVQSVLCQSGNQNMYEKDFGDGGFKE